MFIFACPPPPPTLPEMVLYASGPIAGIALPLVVLGVADLVTRATVLRTTWPVALVMGPLAVQVLARGLPPLPETRYEALWHAAWYQSLCYLFAAACLVAMCCVAISRALQPGEPRTEARWAPNVLTATLGVSGLCSLSTGILAWSVAEGEWYVLELLLALGAAAFALPLLAQTGTERLDSSRSLVASLALGAAVWVGASAAVMRNPTPAQVGTTALALFFCASLFYLSGARPARGALALHVLLALVALAGMAAGVMQGAGELSSL